MPTSLSLTLPLCLTVSVSHPQNPAMEETVWEMYTVTLQRVSPLIIIIDHYYHYLLLLLSLSVIPHAIPFEMHSRLRPEDDTSILQSDSIWIIKPASVRSAEKLDVILHAAWRLSPHHREDTDVLWPRVCASGVTRLIDEPAELIAGHPSDGLMLASYHSALTTGTATTSCPGAFILSLSVSLAHSGSFSCFSSLFRSLCCHHAPARERERDGSLSSFSSLFFICDTRPFSSHSLISF